VVAKLVLNPHSVMIGRQPLKPGCCLPEGPVEDPLATDSIELVHLICQASFGSGL